MDTASNQPSQTFIPITFMTGVYNEEVRIRYVLEHAVRWADEVIVVNKSSTDRTKEICLEYGDRVKVIDIPFSPRGHEDTVAISQLPSNDWIYFGPASEIPTRKLIERIRQILAETHGELDLVYVPRKYYSFGIHDRRSPWSVSYFPFLVNRKKAIITNTLHHNFKPRDPQNTVTIEFSDECCVYHLTHTTAKDYMHAMTDYFEAEAIACEDPVAKIQDCLITIGRYGKQLREGGDELLGHYFAWSIYWFGTALFVWEKWRGVDVGCYYRQLAQQVLQREWLQYDGADGRCVEALPEMSDNAGEKTTPLDHAESPVYTNNLEHFINGYDHDLGQRINPGFIAFAAGELPSARRHFISAIWRNPHLLRDRGFRFALLESVFGMERVNCFRNWRRKIKKRFQQQ